MNKAFLMELLKTGSVSGNEAQLEKKIYDYMQDKAEQVTVDELGNVTAAINPDATFKVLAAGHADEIGLMVSAVGSDGMLMVTHIGGIYPTTYPGHKVRVYTKTASFTARWPIPARSPKTRSWRIPTCASISVLRTRRMR
jgi:endoglucanase